MNVARTVTIAVTLTLAAAAHAQADPIDTTLSLTINALTGQHQTGAGFAPDTLTLVPLPLAELTLRRNRDALRIEGLPPVSFRYGSSNGDGATTQLSIVNATYRRTIGRGWFAGIGETLYNQSTLYRFAPGYSYTRYSAPGMPVYTLSASERQYSRVDGLRAEAGRIFARGTTRYEIFAAVNPLMHGIQYTSLPTSVTGCRVRAGTDTCTTTYTTTIFADPENAAQIDITARAAHTLRHHAALLYGLRYINYTARYPDEPGQLADRNVGLAPTLGYRIQL